MSLDRLSLGCLESGLKRLWFNTNWFQSHKNRFQFNLVSVLPSFTFTWFDIHLVSLSLNFIFTQHDLKHYQLMYHALYKNINNNNNNYNINNYNNDDNKMIKRITIAPKQ